MPSCGTKKMAGGGAVGKNKRSYDGGIYTAEMGPPPFDIDMGSSPKPTKKEMIPPKPAPKQKLKEAPRDLMPEDFARMKREEEAKKKKKMAAGGAVKKEMRFPPSYDEKGRIENRIKELNRESNRLRQEVENSSSYSARTMQTLGHLAGKKAGEASDYAIRKQENMKEEMAEDLEKQIKDYKDRLKNLDKDKKKMAMGGSVTTPKQQAKVGKVMKEFKAGSLHSGPGGKVVKSPRQAIAIALSEARRMKKK